MGSETLTPAGMKEAILKLKTVRGNKIYKPQNKKTSNYGILSGDFILAREAEEGDYKVNRLD